MSCSGPSTDDSFTQYRTHLFFNASRSGNQDDNGGYSFKIILKICVRASQVVHFYAQDVQKENFRASISAENNLS